MNQHQKTSKIGPHSLAVALWGKDRRGLRHIKKALPIQAEAFSPFYRDFIETIIRSSALRIKQGKEGYIKSESNPGINANKRASNLIVADVTDIDTLPHELGHALDFWYGLGRALTSTVILEDGKTFHDILTGELSRTKKRLERELKDLYRTTVDKALGEKASETILGQIDLYRKLGFTFDESSRQAIHRQLWETGFAELFYSLFTKQVTKEIGWVYSPLWDLLSAVIRLDNLGLPHHDYDYYLLSRTLVSEECFANLFHAEVCSIYEQMDHFKSYFPQTYAAFQKLFSFGYEGIMHHQRNIVRV